MGQMMCHKSDQAMSPLMNFDRMGLMSDQLIAAHMTTLTPEEITICGDKIVSVAHCPTSNMKLVCGNSPVEVRPRPLSVLQRVGRGQAVASEECCVVLR